MTLNAQARSYAQDDSKESFIGLAPLMKKAFSGIDLKPLGARLITHAANHPDDAHALMNLAIVLLLTGHRDLALATQMEALQIQQVYRIPAAGAPRLKVLALMAAGDLMANTPLEFLLEDSDIALDMLYVGPGIPDISDIPEHDVMFVAIGESDKNRQLLEELQNIVQAWPRPVLNAPEKITHLARDRASGLLSACPGIVMPTSVRIDRESLQRIGNQELPIASLIKDAGYPVIVRPVGSHAGHGLQKIDSADAVASYLQAESATEFYVARFVDYRSADGLFRKYRIMLIQGQPFICHMAISSHWMIHYLNAGMADNAEKREEEARFMAAFEQEFVPRHEAAFQAAARHTGLDYVGLDCGETPDGKLLIFEADSDMIVHAMDPVDMFPYKVRPMQKLFDAFREMLCKAAASAG